MTHVTVCFIDLLLYDRARFIVFVLFYGITLMDGFYRGKTNMIGL